MKHPFVMGSSYGGIIAQLGPDQPQERKLAVGDKVFGFAFRNQAEHCHQTYMTTDSYLVSKLPAGVALEQAVAVPCNLITAFHTLTADLGLDLPWPVPETENKDRDKPVVVWGAASSVGNYAVQVLKHWGFRNVVAVAREKHHSYLKELGASVCFDYTDGDVVKKLLEYIGEGKAGEMKVPYVLDCIGSLDGTIRKISLLAERGTKVAIMLPVIVTHANEEVAPVYEMDVSKVLPGQWKDGVMLKGTRTHFYLQNEFFKDRLQADIIPALLEQGVIKPNRLRIVDGEAMLERAENARKLLRSQAVSGEKLIWRVSDD